MKSTLFIMLLLSLGCSDDSSPSNTPNNTSDVLVKADANNGQQSDAGGQDVQERDTPSGEDMGIVEGILPDPFSFEGVAYIGHLESGILQWIRTDGTPNMGGQIDIGEAIIELAIDRKRHLLAAALPGTKEVKIFELDTPQNPGTPIAAPKEVFTLSFSDPVLGIKFDPFHNRLYAMKTLPLPAEGPQKEGQLYIYDTTSPADLKEVGTPINLPLSISWDIDPVRQVLFSYSSVEDKIYAYDLKGDQVVALPGEPIDAIAWYPESNQNAFNIRNLKVDPWTHRIFGARAQGGLSELIAIEYASVIPNSTQSFSDLSSMSDLRKREDGFDLSKDLDSRPFILDAANVLVDNINGMIWMSTASWDGTRASYGAMSFRADTLAYDKNCEDSPTALMCWYRSFSGGVENAAFHITDGAACIDGKHKVFVGTSYDPLDNTQPGHVHLFQYTSAGEMTRVTLDSSNLAAFPVAAVCH